MIPGAAELWSAFVGVVATVKSAGRAGGFATLTVVHNLLSLARRGIVHDLGRYKEQMLSEREARTDLLRAEASERRAHAVKALAEASEIANRRSPESVAAPAIGGESLLNAVRELEAAIGRAAQYGSSLAVDIEELSRLLAPRAPVNRIELRASGVAAASGSATAGVGTIHADAPHQANNSADSD